MSNARTHFALDGRNLALAIVQALQMWSNERYKQFLCDNPGSIDAAWFQWFTAEWNVARTIQEGKCDVVREYLDQDFRRAVTEKSDGNEIDDAALHIRESGWSAKLGKNKKLARPTSLVSKIGFFLRPSELVPLDRYSLIGLNQLHRTSSTPKLKGPTYQQYLAAFNEQYEELESQIQASLNESWVSTLAEKLGCPAEALKKDALPRKVFDNYLMHSGGFLKNQAKQSAA